MHACHLLWQGNEMSETTHPSRYFIISVQCVQAFKEMLYAAQDQAPSIEGNTMPHINTVLVIYVLCIQQLAHIVVV